MFQTLYKFSIYCKNINYKLKNVIKSFEDRLEYNDYDKELLMRICNSYTKSKQIQKGSGNIFSPSNEWLPIYENNLKEVILPLNSHDYIKLHKLFSNFYREDCSEGLVGSYNMKK
jgi:hypothetical protein